jgi:N-methylhydantoinase A
LAAGDYGAIAICLLHAWRNPAHEERLAHLIQRHLQGAVIACSSQISPEFREYERASTTVIAAHVQPVIADYLGRFERFLTDRGFAGSFSVMQSNGGRLPAAGMRTNPVTALFSGPAAGAMGAARQAALSGYKNLVTFDMGGTSTDVCLVENGEPEMTGATEIDGLPVRTPLLDIVSIGAGCGSIVWLDDGGMLRVGPMSAGADPGPACYGRGGERPTITDAHVVRGTIRAEAFLGGSMRIDRSAAHRAFERLASGLGMGIAEAAGAAIGLATGNIVRAIQLVSTERGRDPRDYALVAFGGAGPLHAARIAEDLGIGTILVPPTPASPLRTVSSPPTTGSSRPRRAVHRSTRRRPRCCARSTASCAQSSRRDCVISVSTKAKRSGRSRSTCVSSAKPSRCRSISMSAISSS